LSSFETRDRRAAVRPIARATWSTRGLAARSCRTGAIRSDVSMRKWLFLSIPFLAVLIAGSTWLALYPALPADRGGVADLDGDARRVRVAVAPGDSVDGWFVPGTRPATILLLHGYGRTHRRMWRYGQFLHHAGYGVLAIDFRSARAARRLPTTLGHYELIDAQAALDWMRAQPGPPRRTFGVLGESLGGSVAMMLAARNPDVTAVVEDCGFASGRQALEESCERWAHLPRWPTAQVARWLNLRLTGFDPYGVDVLSSASALSTRPVLFIQGLEDDRFSPLQVHELWVAAGSKDPLWLIPDSGHTAGWRMHRGLYEQRVLSFFDQHLLGIGPGIPAQGL
jgi:pimeloyl-ACP methyl ester carboxylesterase